MSCSWCHKKAVLYEVSRLHIGYCQESCQNSLYAFVEGKREREGDGYELDSTDVEFENFLNQIIDDEKAKQDLPIIWASMRKKGYTSEDLDELFRQFALAVDDSDYGRFEIQVNFSSKNVFVTIETPSLDNLSNVQIYIKQIEFVEEENYFRQRREELIRLVTELKKTSRNRFMNNHPEMDEYDVEQLETLNVEDREAVGDWIYAEYREKYLDESGAPDGPKISLKENDALPPIIQELSNKFSLMRKNGNVLYQSLMQKQEDFAMGYKRIAPEIATYFSVGIFLLQNGFSIYFSE